MMLFALLTKNKKKIAIAMITLTIIAIVGCIFMSINHAHKVEEAHEASNQKIQCQYDTVDKLFNEFQRNSDDIFYGTSDVE